MLARQLVDNAVLPSPSQLAFAKRRSDNSLRDAFIHVETRTDTFDFHLTVNLGGNMSAAICRRSAVISNGFSESRDDWEAITWSDTGNDAIVHTTLTRSDLQDVDCAKEVMRRYLESISTEQDAICAGGFGYWLTQIQLVLDLRAQRIGRKLELDILLPRTTCPGMEHMHPWQPPTWEMFSIDGDNAVIERATDEERRRIDEINLRCRPRRSSIHLDPPFMVRKPWREIFHSTNL